MVRDFFSVTNISLYVSRIAGGQRAKRQGNMSKMATLSISLAPHPYLNIYDAGALRILSLIQLYQSYQS